MEFVVECSGCSKINHTSSCASYKKEELFCTLCGLSVKGAANGCLVCGHGGHLMHMMQWFKVQIQKLFLYPSSLYVPFIQNCT